MNLIKNHKTQIRAAKWMMLSTLSFTVINALVRYVTPYMSSLFQLAFIQYVIASLFLLPLAFHRPNILLSFKKKWPIYVSRAMCGAASTQVWYYSLKHLPLSETVAIGLINIPLTMISGYLFLKEKITFNRWLAAGIGLLGAMMIIRPAYLTYHWVTFLPVIASIFFTFASILTRYVKDIEAPYPLLMNYMILMTLFIAGPAIQEWQPIDLQLWPILIIMGFFFALAQFAFTQSFMTGEVSFVAPFILIRFPITALIGWVFFAEAVHKATWIGTTLIGIACLYISWDSKKLSLNLQTR